MFADYVIIMGYDEHHGGSPEAGSVSSYNFVQEGIEETLKEVPAEKVIRCGRSAAADFLLGEERFTWHIIL